MLSVLDPVTTATRQDDRFDALFRQFYPRLVPLAERLLADRAEAEDIVQEAFLRLAREGAATQSVVDGIPPRKDQPMVAAHASADEGDGGVLLDRPPEVVGAWLRRVVLNLGMNRLRDRRRATERIERAARLDFTLDPERGQDDEAGPARAVTRAETRAEVQTALTALPARQRECLLLRHAGYSYAEIAATLGIAIGSVGVYLMRAERAFRIAYQAVDPATGPDAASGAKS